jgi:hypothetical protein
LRDCWAKKAATMSLKVTRATPCWGSTSISLISPKTLNTYITYVKMLSNRKRKCLLFQGPACSERNFEVRMLSTGRSLGSPPASGLDF